MERRLDVEALLSKEIYRELIRLLLIDGSLPNKEIAISLSVTPSAITQRKGKLRELGILCDGKINLSAIRPHRIMTMLFKLKLGSGSNADKAADYFSSLDYVVKVTKLASDDFDLRVDYLVFREDEFPEDQTSGTRHIEKAQLLKEVPVEIQHNCRFHEGNCVFDDVERHINLLLPAS